MAIDKKEVMTENGLTVVEEARILYSHAHDEVSGPFSSVEEVMAALRK